MADCDRGVEIDPVSPLNHSGKYTVYLANGEYCEALESYDELLERKPDNALAHLYKGRIHYGLGEYDEAVTHFDEAIRIDSESDEPILFLFADAHEERELALRMKGHQGLSDARPPLRDQTQRRQDGIADGRGWVTSSLAKVAHGKLDLT